MKRIILITLLSIITFNIMAQQKIVQTAGHDALGDFAPEFAHLNDDILLAKSGAAMICCRSATAVSSRLLRLSVRALPTLR